MTIEGTRRQLITQLAEIYDQGESASIADWVIEYVTGQPKTDRLAGADKTVTPSQQQQLAAITAGLLRHVPLQYVLHECWFADMKLYVDESVLIPRPETEELVAWIAEDAKPLQTKWRTLLDIGTGSGCIAIALKKKLPQLSVRATDQSEAALNVAIKNAMLQAAQVYFIRNDFLDETGWRHFGRFDVIVSNPPYIKKSEAASMRKNVLDFEPGMALFVPDEDALVFYRKIADFSLLHLEAGGAVYLEINEALGQEVCAVFSDRGYTTELRKDMQGKDGMVQLFYGIASSGELTLNSIAGGIYTKMITSATGLIIGLMAYVGHNYLTTQIDKTAYKMEAASAEFLDILQEPTR